jgi:hypothetical protein
MTCFFSAITAITLTLMHPTVNWRRALYRAFYLDALGNRMHDVCCHRLVRRVIIQLINACEFIWSLL